jgi:hypothetical protein
LIRDRFIELIRYLRERCREFSLKLRKVETTSSMGQYRVLWS